MRASSNARGCETKSMSPSGAPNVMMSTGGTQLKGILEDDGIYAWNMSVDWKDPSKTKATGPEKIAVAPYHYLCDGQLKNCVPQPGTDRWLDSQGDQIMSRLVYRRIGNREAIVGVLFVNTTVFRDLGVAVGAVLLVVVARRGTALLSTAVERMAQSRRNRAGPRAGARVRRCGDRPEDVAPTTLGSCHARADGFDLHAGLVVRAGHRDRLERVCRYALRPPLAQERLHRTRDGEIWLTLRHRWADGTTRLRFDPLELLERLAVLTPRPRVNLILYYGVLAREPRGARRWSRRRCQTVWARPGRTRWRRTRTPPVRNPHGRVGTSGPS